MKRFVYILSLLLITACEESVGPDAQGTFEATEVVVSAEANGRILYFNVAEGQVLKEKTLVGAIDSVQLYHQRKLLFAQRDAMLKGLPDAESQVAAIREQISAQSRELQRVENLLKDSAATIKQRDDIKSQIAILEGQLKATLSTLETNSSAINGNATAIAPQVDAINDQIAKCRIYSPIGGTVLVKYAEAGELATVGKPLMKVADLSQIYLRAYFTSDQLAELKLGDEVKVTAVFGADQKFDYKGKIAWISPESEFTPKNIQTKDSRANLVYAVKIAVKNDGRLKVGLAGEVDLHPNDNKTTEKKKKFYFF
jgi:HlyD family secretion protein